jgi:beta-glucosidase
MTQANPFLWGVSCSTYQHEGGFNQPGQPLNNWYEWEKTGKVETTGRSVDFWNRYEEDFERANSIGLNSFRLGLSWSRLQPCFDPDSQTEPPFDDAAIHHYAKILISARQRGLEPLITLHHFDHPHWLGLDAWLQPETLDRFLRYIEKVIPALNHQLLEAGQKPIRWFITINEPNMLTLATYLVGVFPGHHPVSLTKAEKSLQNMLIAHVRAYRLLHSLYQQNVHWGKPMVSFNNYTSDLYWMDQALMDVMLAPSSGVPQSEIPQWLYERFQSYREAFRQADLPFYRGIAYWLSLGLKGLHNLIGHHLIRRHSYHALFQVLYERPEEKPLDYIAFDYYDPFVGHSLRWPRLEEWLTPQRNLHSWFLNNLSSKTWHWRILPQGLCFFVTHYAEVYPDLPLVIAENGMAHMRPRFQDIPWRHDGMTRSDFLTQHIPVIQSLRKLGYPLEGYFHWSLTDNYEWGSYAARFGLYEVDLEHDSLERLAVNALGDNPAQTLSELIRESN